MWLQHAYNVLLYIYVPYASTIPEATSWQSNLKPNNLCNKRVRYAEIRALQGLHRETEATGTDIFMVEHAIPCAEGRSLATIIRPELCPRAVYVY